jgi:hypothetical protein
MKLRQLFEGLGQEVAIIFGRFNPPHKGHRAAWELASKSPIWYVGTNESTVGPKDPLPYGIKVEAMTAIWPEVEGHIIAETSWLTLASLVYEKHGDVTLLCLTDEDWVTKTIVQYNGKEGAHGFYNFKQIKQKPTPRLSSATALRDAVSKGDREAFATAAGVDADTPVTGKPFFDLVAEYLLPYSNAPVKKTVKKKVAAPVEGVTESVPQPGPSSGAPKQFGSDAKIQTRQMTVKDIISSVPGVPYYNNVVDDWDAKDYSWGVTKKVIEYATYLKDHPESLAKLPPAIVLNGKFEDGAHRVSAIWLLQQRMDPKNPLWKNAKLNVQFVKQGVAEGSSNAVADTAKRLANKDDGKVAKLRAAGDKRREEHLKGRDIAKRDSSSKDAWGDYKKEDAAGVGIITKQNSTVDVNKGTPRKNLKAFRLVK